MIKRTLLIIFVFFLASVCRAEVFGGEYIHVPDKRPPIGLFPGTNGVTVGDVAYDAEFCADGMDYICFEAKEIKFAVPKNLNNINAWMYKNDKYKVLRHLNTRGDRPTWIIEKTTGMKMWFVWSSYNGLVMFGIDEHKNQRGVYMLDGICGFAANAACERSLKK